MTSFGPFSTSWTRYNAKPHDVAEKIKTYWRKLPSRPKDDPIYQRALDKTRRQYTLGHKVKPYHINDVIRRYPHPDRSPGLPYTLRGMRKKSEVPVTAIKSFNHNLKYGIYKKCATPCNISAKSMVGKQPKFRIVWVYPAHMTFSEGMFAMPLISAYQEKRGSYAIWCKYALGHMRTLCAKKKKKYTWLGLDWSAFDSNVPAWLIRDCFHILKDQINFTEYQGWGSPSTPGTLEQLWKTIVDYFINTPIKFPDGHVEKKGQGVPSGSYFTNIMDSLCSSVMKNYLFDACNIKYDVDADWELGDDGLTAVIKSTVCMDTFAKIADKKFGSVLNIEKSELSETAGFLGYNIGAGALYAIPQANEEKLTAQLLLPDRPDRTLEDFAARARALQLSCFVLGCIPFFNNTQNLLAALNMDGDDISRPHKRSELWTKMEALGLDSWPPLDTVYLSVK